MTIQSKLYLVINTGDLVRFNIASHKDIGFVFLEYCFIDAGCVSNDGICYIHHDCAPHEYSYIGRGLSRVPMYYSKIYSQSLLFCQRFIVESVYGINVISIDNNGKSMESVCSKIIRYRIKSNVKDKNKKNEKQKRKRKTQIKIMMTTKYKTTRLILSGMTVI